MLLVACPGGPPPRSCPARARRRRRGSAPGRSAGPPSSRPGPARRRWGCRGGPPGRPGGPCHAAARSTPSTLRKPPSIASARPERTAGSRLSPTFTSFTSSGVRPTPARIAFEERVLVRDAGRGDRLAVEIGGGRDAGLRQRDQRGERPLHEGGDGGHREPLVAREQDLGLVGDREIGPAGGDLLDRRRRIGGNLRLHREAGPLEVAAVEGLVDPGVVRVDVEVQLQRHPAQAAPASSPRSPGCSRRTAAARASAAARRPHPPQLSRLPAPPRDAALEAPRAGRRARWRRPRGRRSPRTPARSAAAPARSGSGGRARSRPRPTRRTPRR